MNRLFWGLSLSLLLFSCRTSSVRQELAADYYNIANAYSDMEEFEKAAIYYTRALELNPSLNQAAYNKARAYLEVGEYDKAVNLLLDLKKQDPENLLLMEMFAYTWHKQGDNEKAVEYYQQCLALDSVYSPALYNLCILEKNNENWEKAREYLEQYIELEDDKDNFLLFAEIEREAGFPEAAISFYEDYLLDNEGSIKIYTDLKELYQETQAFNKVLKMLDLLIARPDSEEKQELHFDKCRIEVLELEDIVNGQKDLQEALNLGFSDLERVEELLEAVDPLYYNELKTIVDSVDREQFVKAVPAEELSESFMTQEEAYEKESMEGHQNDEGLPSDEKKPGRDEKSILKASPALPDYP